MALRRTYEEILAVAGDDLGWDGLKYERVFEAFGLDVSFQPRVLRPHQPAIICVPSRLNPGGAHAVFYENGALVDPTTLAKRYSLGAALASAKGFYQWQPLPGP